MKMSKYKVYDGPLIVGKKYKVRDMSFDEFEDLDLYFDDEFSTPGFNEDMMKFAGKLVTIQYVSDDFIKNIYIEEDDGFWCWNRVFFEPSPTIALSEELFQL